MRPAAVAGLWWNAWQTGIAAQTTIALRLWSLATPAERESAWGRAEVVRMVAEKQQAWLDAGFAVQRTLLRQSAGVLPVLEAGLGPYKRRTTLNAKRLARRL